MAGITLARALQAFERELGSGGSYDRDTMVTYITRSLNYLLYNGGGDILREWVVPVSRSGKTTLPYDLRTPVKYRFGAYPSAGFGAFASAFFDYSTAGIPRCCDYMDWGSSTFLVKPNRVPTSFQPPKGGGRLIATTTNKRDVGKKIMVGGLLRGKPIAGMHNGYKTSGELLTIYDQRDDDKKYSAYSFDEITHVTKDPTCDYVMLSGVECKNEEPFFLSHYHPDETTPQYTEVQAHNGCPSCPSGSSPYLHILGRVDPNIRYVRDEDLLPIGDEEMLGLLAQRARYQDSGNFKEKVAVEADIQILISKIIKYQQPPRKSMSIHLSGSGASLTNI